MRKYSALVVRRKWQILIMKKQTPEFYCMSERGSRKIMIRTVDTDVIVILIGHFYSIVDHYPDADLWVAFGTGKHFRYYHLNTICGRLGREQSWCLPPFHAFTGCDSTSSFYGKTKKKTACATWSIYPEVSEAFVFMLENIFAQTDCTSHFFLLLERFTVLLYDKPAALNQLMKHVCIYFARKVEVWKTYHQHR